MSALAEVARGCPFSNGDEGDAWMDAWCRYCANDHTSHIGEYSDGGCHVVLWMMTAEQNDTFPECLLPEPDDGKFALPSRMVCTLFAPCEPCGGDPGAADRAQRVAEVVAYWKERA